MKIIASDYDGTLRRDGTVTDTDKAAVKKWRAAGNLFGFATGRGLPSLMSASDGIEADFYVCCGGAAVYDGKGGLLCGKPMKRELLMLLLGRIDLYEAVTFGYQFEDGYQPLRKRGEKLPLSEDMQSFYLAPASFTTVAAAAEFVSDLKRDYGDVFNPQHNGVCVDVAAAGVTKATGIYDMLSYTGIHKDDVITVGDNFNDAEMIKEFNGVTVTNGIDEIKKISRAVYTDFTELTEDNF